MGEGKSNPEIGAILGISPRTAGKHLELVFQKIDVDTRGWRRRCGCGSCCPGSF